MRYACESSDEDISDQCMLTLRLFWILHNLYKDHCINFFTVNEIKYPTKSNFLEKRFIYTLRGMGHHWGRHGRGVLGSWSQCVYSLRDTGHHRGKAWQRGLKQLVTDINLWPPHATLTGKHT